MERRPPVHRHPHHHPDDWHLHVRDGEPLHTVVPHTAAQFGRAIIMPNLRPGHHGRAGPSLQTASLAAVPTA